MPFINVADNMLTTTSLNGSDESLLVITQPTIFYYRKTSIFANGSYPMYVQINVNGGCPDSNSSMISEDADFILSQTEDYAHSMLLTPSLSINNISIFSSTNFFNYIVNLFSSGRCIRYKLYQAAISPTK